MFSKKVSIILRHDVKNRDHNLDPVNKDEWNHKIIWPMTSVTKWIARQPCFTRHFKTLGFRQAFDAATKSNANLLMMIAIAIVALLELNAIGIFGGIKAGNKMLWMYESHKNALITSGILWLILWISSEVLLG